MVNFKTLGKIYNKQSLLFVAITALCGILSLIGFFWDDNFFGIEFAGISSPFGILSAMILSPIAYFLTQKIKITPLFLDILLMYGIWLLAATSIVFSTIFISYAFFFFIYALSNSITSITLDMIKDDMFRDPAGIFLAVTFKELNLVHLFIFLLPIIMIIMTLIIKKKKQ